MNRNVIETILGALVLAVAGVFLAFAFDTASLRQVDGYEVTARFQRIDGVSVGTDVLMSGVKIGSVTGQRLDPDTFDAVLTLSIDPAIRMPFDTIAIIQSESLLGGKIVALDPGGDPDFIEPGGEIEFTQSAASFENLLGQVIFQLQGLADSQAQQ